MTKVNRRDFLRSLAITGVVGVSTAFGYRWWQQNSQAQSPLEADVVAPPLPPSATVPLLLLTNTRSTNPFGSYLAEILRAEGLNLFQVSDLQTVDAQTLGQFALVLLAEGPLDPDQADLLETYVAEGGRLVAMRPDPRLALLFGVESTGGVTTDGYLQVDTDQTFQFHGQADHYQPTEATVIAWLYRDAVTPAKFPAVTRHQHGQGQAALWAFDLARSIAYTRQGNPDWVNQERDGADGIRAHDAFVDWIDLERIAVPQADEQMRLLSRLIGDMLAEVLPLPNLWYFPNASPAMLIATGDAHANPTANIEALLSTVEAYGGAISIYYTPPARSANALRRQAGLAAQQLENWFDPFPDDPNHLPTPAEVADWRARGHEFSLHPYVEAGIEPGYQSYAAAFEAEGYGTPQGTVRTHRILWSGWADTAKVQTAHGFGMNLDFYHIGPSFQTQEGRWTVGYFTGSGLPLKMVDEQGQVIDNYQLLTELVDEYLLSNVNAGWAGLDSQAAVAVSQQVIDAALTYHSALAAQFHFDFYAPDSPVRSEVEAWAKGTLAYAAENGLPIWSAAHFLKFVRCRTQAHLYDLTWHDDQQRLSFQLLAGQNQDFELTLRLAGQTGGRDLSKVEVDGQPGTFTLHKDNIRQSYGLISVSPGQHTIDVWYAKS